MTTEVVQQGVSQTFMWEAPRPVTVAPTLTFRPTAGDEVIALTQVHAAITITAIAADRKTLTASGAISDDDGLQGEFGAAWLVANEDGVFPVRVVRTTGTSVIVADPLPRGLSLASNASLVYALWSGSLTSGDVTATVERVPWDCVYTPNNGTDAPAPPARDEGVLKVVRQPFATGLTHSRLVSWFPQVAALINSRAGGHDAAIDAARLEVVARLRELLVPDGLDEHDVNGRDLAYAHAYVALALIQEQRGQSNDAELSRRSALGVLDETTGRRRGGLIASQYRGALWVDADQDGVIDAGETDDPVAGPTAGRGLASFYTSADYDTTDDKVTGWRGRGW